MASVRSLSVISITKWREMRRNRFLSVRCKLPHCENLNNVDKHANGAVHDDLSASSKFGGEIAMLAKPNSQPGQAGR